MYQSFRVVTVNDAVSAPVVTNSGVAAGCTMATFLIRAYLRSGLKQFKREYLGVSALYAIRLATVSYTHLTLPTILLV